MSKRNLDGAALDALAAINSWTWLKCDPDGVPLPIGMPISEAINKLALEGFDCPEDILLVNLCNGSLSAQGSISWKKFANFRHYSFQEYQSKIPTSRWLRLKSLIFLSRVGQDHDSYTETTVLLEELGMRDCKVSEWEPQADWFSLCDISDDRETWEDGYFEEWFSASDLEMYPSDIAREAEHQATAPSPSEHLGKRSGGRPPAKWWADFAEELALYLHDEGFPEGEGVDGQDEMIDRIFARMNGRGKAEGSRTSVQPVVRSVLMRLREAGK